MQNMSNHTNASRKRNARPSPRAVETIQSSLIPKAPRSLRINTASSTRISNTVSLSFLPSHSFSTSRSILVSKLSSWLTSLLSLLSNTAFKPGSSSSARLRTLMLCNVLYRLPSSTEYALWRSTHLFRKCKLRREGCCILLTRGKTFWWDYDLHFLGLLEY